MPNLRTRLAWLLIFTCGGLAAEERFSDTSERVCREYGIGFMPEEGTDEERALSLLQFMNRDGIADLADDVDRTN